LHLQGPSCIRYNRPVDLIHCSSPWSTGTILAILAPIIGAPIAVYLFGGVTGGGIDILYAMFMHQDMGIFTSAFLARIPANLLDKLLSAYLIMFIVRKLPPTMQGYGVKLS